MLPRRSTSWIALALALGGSASAQLPADGARASRRAHQPPSIVDEADGGALSPARRHTWLPQGGGTQPLQAPINYTIGGASITTPSGWPENFLFVAPRPTPTTPKPLLVIFHKYGTSQKDLIANTQFAQEAGRRGWYVVCPLGASPKHFSSLESQVNTETVLEWMLANFPRIDPKRIYGIGFSMGGGAVTNYAARHLDPAKPMLAAVIDLCGGVALKDTYLNDFAARLYLDYWFGNGTPGSADAFKLARSSVVNFDPITAQVEVGQDLARNLLHVPLQILRPGTDKVPYVPRQCDVLAAHMQQLGLSIGTTFNYQLVPFGMDVIGHDWSLLDEVWACDWLSQFTLTLPAAGSTLADHDGVYFDFFVTQDAPGAFTQFDWSIDTAHNDLRLGSTANLRRLEVDLPATGLSSAQPLGVRFGTADGLADEVVLSPWPSAPTNVWRNGFTTQSWSYNPATLELALFELDGFVHDWLVAP